MFETFLACSIGSQLHFDTAIDCITLRFSNMASSDDGNGSTKGGDVVYLPVDPEAIRL